MMVRVWLDEQMRVTGYDLLPVRRVPESLWAMLRRWLHL